MSIDLARSHGWVVQELSTQSAVADSMVRLIRKCAAESPHPDWDELSALPYSDLAPLRTWIERPIRLEPPGEVLKGLWFGIFNPVYDGEPLADFYISGSKRFSPDPNDLDWASGPDWWPENRYAGSESMAAIYRIAYREGGLGNNAEYPLCLAYSALAVRELLNGFDHSLLPETIASVGVVVGFDSGDAVSLGSWKSNRLVSF